MAIFIFQRNKEDPGDGNNQFGLGVAYEDGRRKGVQQSAKEAALWYRKAADQGHAAAQFALGVAYANGKGVGQSDEEAAFWYLKAAE